MNLRELLGAASKENLQELRSKVQALDSDIDSVFELAQENSSQIDHLEEESKRMDQVIQELRDEIQDDQEITLEGMEQEIFKILMKADQPLSNSDIGERMEKERSGSQVRPKVNSLKDKITLIEDKDGRAKVYSIPKKVKTDYIEKGELAEIENF